MRFGNSVGALALLVVAGLSGTFAAGPAASAAPTVSLPLVGSVVADDGAKVVAQSLVGDRQVDLTIDSPALGRQAKTRLLLPPNWQSQPDRVWPTLYLLHGCCESPTNELVGYRSWTDKSDVAAFTANTDVLVVMPEGGTAGYFSNWRTQPGNDGPQNWETFHMAELRQLLERGYRSGPRRAVAGLSMGGLGAFYYSAKYPGVFQAAASYSGLVHTRSLASKGLIFAQLIRQGYPHEAVWGSPLFNADIWRAHNPYDLLDKLRGVSLYVSSGNGWPGPLDPPGSFGDPYEVIINGATRDFVDRASWLKVPVTTDLYGSGLHAWPYWERALHRSFPQLMGAIGVEVTAGQRELAAR